MKRRTKLFSAVIFCALLLASVLVFAFASDSGAVSYYDGDKLVARTSLSAGAPEVEEIVLIDGVGYRFIGWSDVEDGTETVELTALEEGTSLYAVREAVEFKLERADGTEVWYAPGETTLSALLTGATAGDYITACSDTDINGSSAQHCQASVTLDLNGNTLTTSTYICVNKSNRVKICNGTVNITSSYLAATWADRKGDAVIELENLVIKKDAGTSKQFLLDLQIGSAIFNNVTVKDGEWNAPESYFIRAGYKTASDNKTISVTVTNSNMTLTDTHFISASTQRTGYQNGYTLDVKITDSTIKTPKVNESARSVISFTPADELASMSYLNVEVSGKSMLAGGAFSAMVIFNIGTNLPAENVNVWADYGVEFARFPKLAVGTLKLGDKEKGGAMLDVLTSDGYGVVADLWVEDHEPATDYAYSFIVVGDTQMSVEYDPSNLHYLYDWIINNVDAKKIEYVFGMGDITNHSKDTEWTTAMNQIKRLNGVVDYSLVRGNHDTAETYSAKINELNPAYKSMMSGYYQEGALENSYDIFTVGSTDFLHITLDYHPSNTVVDWAKSIVASHPDHRVIISTHSYLAADGTLDTRNDGSGTNSGKQLWDKLVSQYDNIFLVLSGHVFGTDIVKLQSKGVNGNTVTQLMVNGQTLDYRNGAMGLVAILGFSPDGEQVSVEYYSTVHGKYLGKNSQFTLKLEEKVELTPSEGDVFAVANGDGTVQYYDSTYTLSSLLTSNLVADGATITLFADTDIDKGFRITKNCTIDLNSNTLTSNGGKLQGGQKTVSIINGTIKITANHVLYCDFGYTSSVFNVKDVTIVNESAQHVSNGTGFADFRSGTLNFNNVTVTAEGWGGINKSFISAGYKSNNAFRDISFDFKNSNIDLGTATSAIVGFSSHSGETNGWYGSVSATNSTLATGGYIVSASPSANGASGSSLSLVFGADTVLKANTLFNISASIPTASVSVELALGTKVSSVPEIAGVTVSFSGGVLTVNPQSPELLTVALASDAYCKLVDAEGNAYAYVISDSFTQELVDLAESAGCNIVLLKNMTSPAGTSSSDIYVITPSKLTVDLNNNKLILSSYSRFYADKNSPYTDLTIKNGTVEHAYTVFYSYNGHSTQTKFTASDVYFYSTTTNYAFDFRAGVLTLTDCEFGFKTSPSTATAVFGFGMVSNTTYTIKAVLTRVSINATGTSRSIFRLYDGRQVTVEATDCSFSVGNNAYIVNAAKGGSAYNTEPTDSITLTDCTLTKAEGGALVNKDYDGITVIAVTVVAPTCSAQGYTSTLDLISGMETLSDIKEPIECENESRLFGASIRIGDTLAMIYYVEICECKSIGDYTMRFEMNGNTTVVSVYKVVDGRYAFAFNNIAPQCMGDLINAELLENGVVVDSKEGYSIKENAEHLLTEYASDEALVSLANALLIYGAAAQEYKNYKTDALVTDSTLTDLAKPESTDMTITESTLAGVGFTAAGVWFDYNNKIYIKLTAQTEGTVALLINGEKAELTAEGNGYVAYTDAISATGFADIYTVELTVDGEVVQTLTYSVNSYAYSKWSTENEAMRSLARALYAYGVSAVNYAATKN